jgi:cytochrome c oxidase assembly factor CtaG
LPDPPAPEHRRPARLLWSGVAVALVVLLPPVGIWARRWVVGEAVQFSLLAYVVPPLLVLGLSPATRGRLATWPPLPTRHKEPVSRAARQLSGRPGAARYRFDPLEDRPGRGAFDPAAARAWIALVVFVGLVAAWRSQAAVDALARREALALLEAATLVVSGCGLWLNLLDSGAAVAGAGRPRRMIVAALAMWSIWVLAFIVGFSGHPMFSAYPHQAGSGLSALGDQELAVAVLWAVPGLVLVPVVFVNLVSWLKAQEGSSSERPGAGDRAVP